MTMTDSKRRYVNVTLEECERFIDGCKDRKLDRGMNILEEIATFAREEDKTRLVDFNNAPADFDSDKVRECGILLGQLNPDVQRGSLFGALCREPRNEFTSRVALFRGFDVEGLDGEPDGLAIEIVVPQRNRSSHLEDEPANLVLVMAVVKLTEDELAEAKAMLYQDVDGNDFRAPDGGENLDDDDGRNCVLVPRFQPTNEDPENERFQGAVANMESSDSCLVRVLFTTSDVLGRFIAAKLTA